MHFSKIINSLSPDQIGKIFPIEIIPYQEVWESLFLVEKELITNILIDFSKISIEHIGSTAIQGLFAKPIIDILLEYPSLTTATKTIIVAKLNKIDYHNMSNREQKRQISFGKGYDLHDPDKQKFHLHLREKISDFQDEIFFRDYLRENADVRKKYEELKIDLAKKHKNNREDYTQAKTEFITKVTAMAKIYYTKHYAKDAGF